MSIETEFPAYVLRKRGDRVHGALETFKESDLDDGDTTIRVEYSSINYKDALAGTGQGAIARRLPLIGGIDLAGSVVDSENYTAGDSVLVCGCGQSETHHGGYANYARVPGSWAVRIPNDWTTREVMALGTAGLTAALAIDALENNGLSIALAQGPVAVTGATGGVGSFAIDMLSKRGYEVVAITGKIDHADYLRDLGAASVVARDAISDEGKPLNKAEYAAVIDNAGGTLLANLLTRVQPEGAVASIGLAGGTALKTTVLPFILRGVGLLGINSVSLTNERRIHIWQRIFSDLKPAHSERIATREISLENLDAALAEQLQSPSPGRTLVRVAASDI